MATAAPKVRTMKETATMGWDELLAEVISPALCSYCMACIDECRRDGPNAITLEDEAFRFNEDACTRCGLCYVVCPEVRRLDGLVVDACAVEAGAIGSVRRVASAVTRDAAIKKRSADGGVVTSLLLYLLESGRIDGALLSLKGSPWLRKPFIARTPEEILEASGFRTGRHGTIAGRSEQITSIQLLQFLRQVFREGDGDTGRIAVVGTPCEIYTLRKMQAAHVAPADSLEYMIGLLCYENLSLDGWRWARFEEVAGISVNDIVGMNMRDDLVVSLRSGDTRLVDLDLLSQVVSANCLRCVDFTARFSDLSVGNVGSEPGFNTVVTRTEKGDEAYAGAIADGYLMEWTALFNRHAKDPAEEIRKRLVEKTERKRRLTVEKGRRGE